MKQKIKCAPCSDKLHSSKNEIYNYNGMKLLTSSSARLRGNPIIYTRFRWITLTSLRCFLPSEAFGFDFCSFCFHSKFLSATNLCSEESCGITQQLSKYKTKWPRNCTVTPTTFHNFLPFPHNSEIFKAPLAAIYEIII